MWVPRSWHTNSVFLRMVGLPISPVVETHITPASQEISQPEPILPISSVLSVHLSFPTCQ